MALPTFLGIGVPRGGTTWLHTLLSSHPDVLVPATRKEVRFFDRHYDRGLAWYEGFFETTRDGVRAIGEISPQYLYCAECPERIASTLPDVRLVVMLRHPVDRAYSQYGFVVQRRNFRGSFDEFLASREQALEKGFYSRYLTGYLRVFDRARLLPLLFEETFADRDRASARLAEFLGVTAHGFDTASAGVKVNASTIPTHGSASGVAIAVGRRLRRWGLEGVVDFGRRHGAQRAISKGQAFPPLDDETRSRLARQFETEFDELERCLDVDLGVWRER
jgi:hypothetical protein